MVTTIVQRLLLLIPTLLGVLVLTFLLLYVAPGDPVQAMVGERADASADAFLIAVDNEFQAQILDVAVAEFDHLAKFPGGVHMHQRERRLAGVKCLQRQMQHHRRVLADGIEHDRALELGGDFAHDVDAFRFQLLEVG